VIVNLDLTTADVRYCPSSTKLGFISASWDWLLEFAYRIVSGCSAKKASIPPSLVGNHSRGSGWFKNLYAYSGLVTFSSPVGVLIWTLSQVITSGNSWGIAAQSQYGIRSWFAAFSYSCEWYDLAISWANPTKTCCEMSVNSNWSENNSYFKKSQVGAMPCGKESISMCTVASCAITSTRGSRINPIPSNERSSMDSCVHFSMTSVIILMSLPPIWK